MRVVKEPVPCMQSGAINYRHFTKALNLLYRPLYDRYISESLNHMLRGEIRHLINNALHYLKT